MSKLRLARYLLPAISIVLFSAALWVIHRELQDVHYRDILRHLRELPDWKLCMAVLLTAASYLVMSGYDWLAMKTLNRTLAWHKVALASFVSYAFSNNVGAAIVSGGSVRYRLYVAWGLKVEDVARIIALGVLMFFFGIFTAAGLVLAIDPFALPESLHVPFRTTFAPAVILLAIVILYLLFGYWRGGVIRIWRWSIPVPSPQMSLLQFLVVFIDLVLAALVLYWLFPDFNGLGFWSFLGFFLLALIAGLTSQLPGGIGVFETILLVLLRPYAASDEIMAALLAYRVIYYIAPLAVAGVCLALIEAEHQKDEVWKAAQTLGNWVSIFAPQILAFLVFSGGAVLLISGAAPSDVERLGLLARLIPLGMIESSHVLASLSGLGLMILARALQRRIDAAYHLTAGFLVAGIVLCITKGFAYEEAGVLGILLIILLPCRRDFYRKSSILNQKYTPQWIAAIGIVLAASIWVGLFSHKRVNFTPDLWWNFSLGGHAARFLRATAGVLGGISLFTLARLLGPPPQKPARPTASEIEELRPVIESSPVAHAHLAALGDKGILSSKSGRAFLMYGVHGRSWVAMGDPVGPTEEWSELVWRFRELSDVWDGRAVFYQVDASSLPTYLDLGLTLHKLGEEARVRLEGFSLQGRAHGDLRHVMNRLKREECVFEIIPTGGLDDETLIQLHAVSDAWLTTKNSDEKGFSLGFFEEAYLRRNPVAVVRQAGRIIAFGNLWLSGGKVEASVDLMRYANEAPPGVMDFLFTNLFLWAKEQGYGWFNLGMAPLTGLEARPLAPLWPKIGAMIYRHGEHFYNFQGLRDYKEKFDPVWQPKYLASPGGLQLPRVLADVTALISGGLAGVIKR